MPTTNIGTFIKPFDYTKQQREGEEYISGLKEHLGSLEQIPQMYQRLSGELMLPDLRKQYQGLSKAATGLSEQIWNVPEMVAGTTRESLVTAPQRQAMTLKAQEPLTEALTRLSPMIQATGQALTSAETELGKRMGYGLEQQQMSLLPFEKGFDLLTQRQAREYSGYTFSNQIELDRLIANLNAGVTLSEGEKQRLHELALKEQDYKNQLDVMKQQSELSKQTELALIGARGAQSKELERYKYYDLGQGLEGLWSSFGF